VHFQVLAIHPDIEVIQRPRQDDGIERVYPHDATDNWNFKVREGVDRVAFGHPGWRLLPGRREFLSCLPSAEGERRDPKSPALSGLYSEAVSAMPPRVIPHPGDLEKVRPGYIDAVRAEIAAMLEQIPPKELAIQWDCSTELQDAFGRLPGLSAKGAIARNLPQIAGHLCFGTLGGWPRFAPDSTDRAVEMANAFIEGAGRRVDWMHIPLLDRTDEVYYAPLAGLRPNGARIYLGMIHNMANFERRLANSRKSLPEFGVAAYRGFGRRHPSELPVVLAEHVAALNAMHRAS